MAKRIPKTKPKEGLTRASNAGSFLFFVDVCIPGTPQIFTYGSKDLNIKRGSVVWICLAKRKTPELALVLKVSKTPPAFPLKEAITHASHYCFSERYIEILEWTAKYFFSTLPRTLHTFWTADLENYLDTLASGIEQNLPKPPKTNVSWPELTEEQKKALDNLEQKLNATGFQGVLLHGVTGSGKTRVYQELAKKALKQGKKVLILVPEIGLTPQTAKRFEDFLQVPIAILHSALSVPKKRASYVSILNGTAQIVLGTRSAILTPFEFDVVIIDEEQDSSFKQQDSSPRYHTRDLALHIIHHYGGLILLGSATPSIETFFYAHSKKLDYISLSKRATNALMPKVHLINMRKNKQQKGMLLSYELREALIDTLQAGEQAIILMNRRGYSKVRICQSCGESLFCKQCKIPLVFHKQYNALLCHYCHQLYPTNSPCFSCGAETFEFSGGAIEKLEEEIIEWIPNAKVIRMDRDTTQNVGATDKILNAFREREYNVLIGTQMVSKGHDFPGVQLVGIINADDTLCLPDFRSGERLFQLLSQTAGRAGRSGPQGHVFIQTLRPETSIIQYAINHDYHSFVQEELKNRELALYPPYCKLVTLSCGSKKIEQVQEALHTIDNHFKKEPSLKILGPMEAPIPFIQNTYWMKISFKTFKLPYLRNSLLPLLEKLGIKFPKVDFKVELE